MRVEVEVFVEKNFLDFKLLDSALGQVLDSMDHAMILVHTDPLVKILSDLGFRVYVTQEEPTTEYIAGLVLFALHANGVRRVRVYETDKYSAEVSI